MRCYISYCNEVQFSDSNCIVWVIAYYCFKDDMSSLIWISKNYVNPAFCPLDVAPKLLFVDLTGPAAFGSEAERCVIITR